MYRYLLFLGMMFGQQLFAQSYDDYSKKGVNAFNVKNYAEAIDWFSKSIDADKGNQEGYANRGYTYMLMKEFDKAEQDLTKAIQLAPNNAFNYKTRAQIYYNKNNIEAAIADLSKFIFVKPDDYGAITDRGIMYKDLKKDNLAIADFDRSILLNPDFMKAYMEKAYLLDSQNRRDEAIKMLTDKENDPRIHTNGSLFGARGHIYMKAGIYDQALADIKRAESLGCEDWKCYIDKALIETYLKKDDDASASLKKATSLNKSFGQIKNCLVSNKIKPSTGCIDGECETGFGTYLFPSGNKYVGGFKNFAREGKGTSYFSNGDRFEGTFANNEKVEGTYYFANGYKYTGTYDINGKELNGTYYATNGNMVDMKDGVMLARPVITGYAAQNNQVRTCPICKGLGVCAIAGKGTTYSSYSTPNSYSIDQNGNTHVEVYGGKVVLESHDNGSFADCPRCHGKGFITEN